MNRFIFDGRIGKDAEISATSSGVHVCKFSVANSRSFKQGDEWKEKTSWFNVVVFGDEALRTSQLKKGELVLVDGRVEIQKGNDDKYYTSVIAEKVIRIERLKKPDSGAGYAQQEPHNEPEDDGLPF